MTLPLKQEESFKELVTAINTILRKHKSEATFKDEEINGIVILQFPKDHEKTHMIHSTFLGRICERCSINCIIQTAVEMQQGANPLAT